MGLSSNIIWHQTSLEGLIEILRSRKFLCSYSLESIQWRKSSLMVAFPMISFCDLPISDMTEFLTDNTSRELTGKYGECAIGLNLEWAKKKGMNMVWYQDSQSTFLRTSIPQKSRLLKSLKSKHRSNSWMLLSRIKPYTSPLPSKGFTNYRFYDEKEIRYIPHPRNIDKLGLERVLTKDEYQSYKLNRRNFSRDKTKGDALIPDLSISFGPSDVRYILYASENDRVTIESEIKNFSKDVILLSYSRIVEEIIGMSHSKR